MKRTIVAILAVAGIMAGGWFAHVAIANHAIDVHQNREPEHFAADACDVPLNQVHFDHYGPGYQEVYKMDDGRSVTLTLNDGWTPGVCVNWNTQACIAAFANNFIDHACLASR